MINPKLSVVVPIYNSERYMERCINSIINQTYQNIELILIDDGSTDRSQEICLDFLNRDDRIKYSRISNSGPSIARNIGLKMATGMYITFVDSDDDVKDSMYEKMIDLIEMSHADFIVCGYERIVDGTVSGSFSPFQNEGQYTGKAILKHFIQPKYSGEYGWDDCGGIVWNKVFRSEFLYDNSILFNESLRRGEDGEFCERCLECAKRIYVIPDHFYRYHNDNSCSLMSSISYNDYLHWLSNKKEGAEKADRLGISINHNFYYGNILSNIHSLLVKLSCGSKLEKRQCFKILKDDEYRNIAVYDKNNTVSIRMCHRIHRVSNCLAFLAYKTIFLWNRVKGGRG